MEESGEKRSCRQDMLTCPLIYQEGCLQRQRFQTFNTFADVIYQYCVEKNNLDLRWVPTKGENSSIVMACVYLSLREVSMNILYSALLLQLHITILMKQGFFFKMTVCPSTGIEDSQNNFINMKLIKSYGERPSQFSILNPVKHL